MVMKLVTLAATMLGLFVISSGIAWADGGPHGPFTALGTVINGATSYAGCQRCHSAHRGQAADLLRANSTYGLCMSCHSGAERTDVNAGLFLAGSGTYGTPDSYGADNPAASAKTYTHQLNGGRFGNGATSWHKVKDTEENLTQIIYGSGANDASDITTATFKCTSCHEPHGQTLAAAGATRVTAQVNGTSENYRLLKLRPVYSWESPANTGNNVSGAIKSYTKQTLRVQNTEPHSGVSQFCASCHTDYLVDTSGGDCATCHGSIFGLPEGLPNAPGGQRYIHPVATRVHAAGILTNMNSSSYKLPVEEPSAFAGFYQTNAANPKSANSSDYSKWVGGVLQGVAYSDGGNFISCLTCHNAHGSVAMGQNVSSVYNRAGTHSLLRFDERAVCQTCHKMNPGY